MEQCAFIVEHFFLLKLVYDRPRMVSGEVRGARTLPRTSFVRIVKHFQTKFMLSRSGGGGLMRRVMTTAKRDEVIEAITTNPRLSVRKVARMSNMPVGTAHKTLRSLNLRFQVFVYQF